jgi:hypothetical protein
MLTKSAAGERAGGIDHHAAGRQEPAGRQRYSATRKLKEAILAYGASRTR